MENTNRAEVTSAQSREDWLIGRLKNMHEGLQRLRMDMERNAVLRMAENYLTIEDTMQYLAEKRDEKKDDIEEILETADPAADEEDEDEENG